MRAAAAFATAAVERGKGIVYGGGSVGLMGVVARSALAADGEVIGVIPRSLTEREDASERLTELHVVETMHERKAKMSEMASAFVALPGGFGTMEELFEVITWAMLGIHNKPFGLLEVDGFFAPLLRFLDHATDEGFIPRTYRAMVRSHDSPAVLLDQLDDWNAPDPVAWLDLDRS